MRRHSGLSALGHFVATPGTVATYLAVLADGRFRLGNGGHHALFRCLVHRCGVEAEVKIFCIIFIPRKVAKKDKNAKSGNGIKTSAKAIQRDVFINLELRVITTMAI